VLVGGLVVSLIGMAWLSRLGPDTSYLTGIALPMILIGIGQVGTLGPLTAGGLAGVTPEDAGAAGGVTNVAHQIGGSLGLAVLVAVFAAANAGGQLEDGALLAHRISAALTAGAILLALALLIALAVRPRPAAAKRTPASAPAPATGVAAPIPLLDKRSDRGLPTR
jgi:sugar phosphate permease